MGEGSSWYSLRTYTPSRSLSLVLNPPASGLRTRHKSSPTHRKLSINACCMSHTFWPRCCTVLFTVHDVLGPTPDTTVLAGGQTDSSNLLV